VRIRHLLGDSVGRLVDSCEESLVLGACLRHRVVGVVCYRPLVLDWRDSLGGHVPAIYDVSCIGAGVSMIRLGLRKGFILETQVNLN